MSNPSYILLTRNKDNYFYFFGIKPAGDSINRIIRLVRCFGGIIPNEIQHLVIRGSSKQLSKGWLSDFRECSIDPETFLSSIDIENILRPDVLMGFDKNRQLYERKEGNWRHNITVLLFNIVAKNVNVPDEETFSRDRLHREQQREIRDVTESWQHGVTIAVHKQYLTKGKLFMDGSDEDTINIVTSL